MALRAGQSGLECIGHILEHAGDWLVADGVAVLEIAPHQAADGRRLATDAGFAIADVRHDLAGRDRVLVARRV
jgi:methylase of polypeptide subunit release factors